MKLTKSFITGLVATVIMSSGVIATTAYAEDCISLQNQKNVLYAAKGYCFNDPEAQAKYGAECRTKKPNFSEAESKKLAEINAKLSSLNCPKKD